MIEKICEEAINETYFSELVNKLEKSVMLYYSNLDFDNFLLNNKELNDLLRFADIFATSNVSEYRNYSNRIVSNLSIFYNDNDIYNSYAYTIFVKMGLFPSADLLKKNEKNICCSMDVEYLEKYKRIIQKDSASDIVYTDKQYEIVEELVKKNNYSLSAPTSFGKTMIISNFINNVIVNKKECNICILVPTNALLKEVSNTMKAKYEINKELGIKVISYPEVREKDKNFRNLIFVFTPERLLSYYGNNNPEIEYLFIDEAQKIVKLNDERTPIYYNVVSNASYRGTKLYFLSPNICNPELFLTLVGRDEKNTRKVIDKLVSQNRFIFDFDDKTISYLNFDNSIVKQNNLGLNANSLSEAIKIIYKKHLRETPTLVYFSSKTNMFETLLEYLNHEEDTQDDELLKLIENVKNTIHEKYYLVNALKKGIAFHYGQLPKNIREKIEELFKKRKIKILFTTSTLLEGVNVQAKNIILTSDRNGLSKLDEADFLNLIGRAGRFKNELYGNVVCVKFDSSTIKYKYFQSQNPENLHSEIIDSTRGNFYKDIKNFILNKKPETKNPEEHKKMMNIRSQYANIAILHNKLNYNSKLNANLIKYTSDPQLFKSIDKNDGGVDKLDKYSEYISIPISYQNKVYSSNEEDLSISNPKDINFESLCLLTKKVFDKYELCKRGLVEHNNSYKYYANLLYEWINGIPLKVIINKTITKIEKKELNFWLDVYYEGKRKKFKDYEGTDRHINLIINDILEKIENDVKHMIKNYFSNFIYLNIENGKFDKRMIELEEYIEFGTKKIEMIELQKFGFSRELSSYLIDKYIDYIVFKDGELESIDIKYIVDNFDNDNPLIDEMKEFEYLI